MSEDVKKALEDVSALVAIVAKDTGALVMSDPAEDSVGSTLEGDLEMTFGHVRRAHAALSTLESLQRENEALKKDRDFWKEQFQVETRYRIELADRGTLLALTDANSRAEAAEAEVKRLQAEIDRTARNRDMWKGQVERQAAQIEDFRSETKRLQVGVYVETLPAAHLISVFADDMNERNWGDKRAYIKQQADRIRTALASTRGEHHADK